MRLTPLFLYYDTAVFKQRLGNELTILRLPPFGHGFQERATHLEILVCIVCIYIFVVAVIDWKKMERWWGIKAPILFKVFDDVSYF